MDLPPEAIAAREKAFKLKPKGKGGRCLWCNADHRFGPSWWPRAEREAHVRAVAASTGTALDKLHERDRTTSTVSGAAAHAGLLDDGFDPEDERTLSDYA